MLTPAGGQGTGGGSGIGNNASLLVSNRGHSHIFGIRGLVKKERGDLSGPGRGAHEPFCISGSSFPNPQDPQLSPEIPG